MTAVFLLHLAGTVFMAGIIWFVQLVHYPLLGRVGAAQFVPYEEEHMRRTSWVVTAPMLLELGTALALAVAPPPPLAAWSAWTGLGLLAAIWLSTGLLQARQHVRLARAFDPATHRALVATNWIRTAAWTLRAALVLWMASRLAAA